MDDAVEFIRQTLEGLIFMHEKGVAHRDCARYNLMMDATPLYPEGSHPQKEYLTIDTSRWTTVLHRYQACFPKYYLIDFGISTWFKEGHDGSRLVVGANGQDKSVPELHHTTPYDPFKVDIYTLGNLFKEEFIDKYRGFSFLIPLVERMTLKEPSERPSAAEAMEQFQICRKGFFFALTFCRRLTPLNQKVVPRILRDGWHLFRRATSIRRGS